MNQFMYVFNRQETNSDCTKQEQNTNVSLCFPILYFFFPFFFLGLFASSINMTNFSFIYIAPFYFVFFTV